MERSLACCAHVLCPCPGDALCPRHQSAVECVTFDQAEEVVVAGAAGGTLKLWDLEEAKVVRTLMVRRCKIGPSLIATCFQPLNLRVHAVLST